ncbi:hypothetical protein PUN28_012822 [Cardiocondyla obscurior]|uniref:Uncharacterized protein n=1 Tax=Cardiocondyla obscurior TaxID=286306 RepID=A0AAW2F7G3_9HYME
MGVLMLRDKKYNMIKIASTLIYQVLKVNLHLTRKRATASGCCIFNNASSTNSSRPGRVVSEIDGPLSAILIVEQMTRMCRCNAIIVPSYGPTALQEKKSRVLLPRVKIKYNTKNIRKVNAEKYGKCTRKCGWRTRSGLGIC